MATYASARIVLRLPEAYWAPIAALVVIYPDRTAAKKAAVARFLGTALGSLVGWACAAWGGESLLAYGAGILVAVSACYAVGLDAAARLSAVAVTVIAVIPRAEPAHLVALHRFIEVSYGVACALAYVVAVDAVTRRRAGRT
jgi:uncharacterized membrane protein YgaE (UPF0421/DUF939 family)